MPEATRNYDAYDYAERICEPPQMCREELCIPQREPFLSLRAYWLARSIMKRSIPVLPLSFITTAQADVTLPATFSEHMILEADAAAPVWGWAGPGEEVSVSIAGQTGGYQKPPTAPFTDFPGDKSTAS